MSDDEEVISAAATDVGVAAVTQQGAIVSLSFLARESDDEAGTDET